jgi:pimeloyl-ACP methyl ester carboxylesterase
VERFTASDGIELAYQRWGDGTAAVPVFLHHGFVADANINWAAPGIVDALVGAGHDVVAIDARGHGQSDKPHDPARYGEARMSIDLRELFDLIGAPSVDLVGYSMGGIVSLITAATDDRIRRLVVGGIGASAAERGGVDTSAIPRGQLAAALGADDPAAVEHPAAAQFRAFAEAMGGDLLALGAQAASVHQGSIALDRITAPTLVLDGDADDLARRPEVLAAAIPRAELRLVPGDHFGAVTDPGFAAAIVQFLA